MCFIINPKYSEKKIANRDIVCYKVLMRYNLSSPFYNKKYKLNKLYITTLDKPSLISEIHRGFHSYSNKRGIYWFIYNCDCLVKGIIPKGSEYYYNPDRHEYVSNQIVLQEIIK